MKTTKKDFARFKEEARYWIDRLGLKDCEFAFSHSLDRKNRASCQAAYTGRTALLNLSTTWENWVHEDVERDLSKSAFHEVVEALFGPLRTLAESRFNVDNVDLDMELHRVIRTLERVVFEPDYDARTARKGKK